MEQRPGGGADSLLVVEIDRRPGHHDGVRARRVGRTHDGARVPRVPHLDQHRDGPGVLGDAREGDVHETRHRHQALRGHRGGQPGHHLVGDLAHRDPPVPGHVEDRLNPRPRRRSMEQLADRRLAGDGLPDRLGPLDQEPAILLAHGPLLEADGLRHPLVVDRGDHRGESPEPPWARPWTGNGRGRVSSARPRGPAWPRPPGCRTRRGRSPRDRPASCGPAPPRLPTARG